MPYAIHLRKSRADIEAEARGEGESLSRHRARLLDLAARRGYEITGEYAEIVSGSKLSDRPEMQRLLRDVADGMYDGVLDVEISRITRGDLMDQALILNTFKYSGTQIITPEHIYDLSDDWDEEHLTSDMMHARREYRYTNKRLQRGRIASATEGLWQSPTPFGYRKVKIPRGKGYTLEIDEQTAPVVRMIFDWYVRENLGASIIADRLNALGCRTQRGNPWGTSAVLKVTSSPVYAGLVRWNYRVSTTRIEDGQIVTKRVRNPEPILVPGRHPALVSLETFEAVAELRRSHDKTRTHNALPTRNPLAGLVYCACCGKSMIRKDCISSKTGSRDDFLRCATRKCPTSGTYLELVERSILDILSSWLVTYSDDNYAAPATDPRRESIAAAESAIQRLEAQRARIFAAYEDGAYDAPTFIARRNAKDAEIAAAQQTLDALRADTTPTTEEAIRAQLPAIRTALDLYALAEDPQDKRRILKSVISRVEYRKTSRCLANQNPADALELIVYPVFPAD